MTTVGAVGLFASAMQGFFFTAPLKRAVQQLIELFGVDSPAKLATILSMWQTTTLLAWTRNESITLFIIAWFGINIISAVRVLIQFRRMGRARAAAVWCIVTLLLTAIPYLVYATMCRAGWLMTRPDRSDPSTRLGRRCPHCRTLLSGPESLRQDGGVAVCARCGMALKDESRLA